MYIWNSILDEILIHPKLRVEYNGTHAPHNETPLYGRAAYWRVYIDDHFVAKITTPVKVLNPRPETLKKLFRAELKKRIEAIQEVCETDYYGCIYIATCDPYSVRRIVELVEHTYIREAA